MGCCCSKPDTVHVEAEPDARTPLLAGKPGTATSVTQQPVISAYDEPIKSVPLELESSTENGSTPKPLKKKIELASTNVQSVDKRLQDHAKLFNEIFERLTELESTIKELTESFNTQTFENQDIEKSVDGIMRHVATYCEGNQFMSTEEPHPNIFNISYEGKEVHYTVIPALNAYNKAGKLVNDIKTRAGPLIQSVELVIKNEKELKREILVASLGSDGPDSMKKCIKGVKTLKRIPPTVAEIESKTDRIAQQLSGAIDHIKEALLKEPVKLDETDKTVKVQEEPTNTEDVNLEEKDEANISEDSLSGGNEGQDGGQKGDTEV